MTAALTARDTIRAIIEATFPDLAGRVEAQRSDVVERLPAAAVYISDIESEPVARAQVERTASISVEIHRQAANVEDVLFTNAETLEAAVYASRKTLAPGIKRVHLASTTVERDPQERRAASIILTFSAKFAESLT